MILIETRSLVVPFIIVVIALHRLLHGPLSDERCKSRCLRDNVNKKSSDKRFHVHAFA